MKSQVPATISTENLLLIQIKFRFSNCFKEMPLEKIMTHLFKSVLPD